MDSANSAIPQDSPSSAHRIPVRSINKLKSASADILHECIQLHKDGWTPTEIWMIHAHGNHRRLRLRQIRHILGYPKNKILPDAMDSLARPPAYSAMVDGDRSEDRHEDRYVHESQDIDHEAFRDFSDDDGCMSD